MSVQKVCDPLPDSLFYTFINVNRMCGLPLFGWCLRHSRVRFHTAKIIRLQFSFCLSLELFQVSDTFPSGCCFLLSVSTCTWPEHLHYNNRCSSLPVTSCFQHVHNLHRVDCVFWTRCLTVSAGYASNYSIKRKHLDLTHYLHIRKKTKTQAEAINKPCDPRPCKYVLANFTYIFF